MKKKIIIFAIFIVITALSITLFFSKTKNRNNQENKINDLAPVIVDKDGNIIYDSSREDDITEIMKDITIKGRVEVNHGGYIYMFNGQHFGEFGLEMDEYTRAHIKGANQVCIDYFTLQKYDTSYIEEGDLIICTGDLMIKGYSMGNNDFDTKDNPIIVLKSSDYNKMKENVLKGNSKYSSVVTIGDEYVESGYLYLKYSLKDDTYLNTTYDFPFAVKAYINDNTQIIGELQKGKSVKVEYEDIEDYVLKSIEVIEK